MYMVNAMINISDQANQILNIVKAKHNFKDNHWKYNDEFEITRAKQHNFDLDVILRELADYFEKEDYCDGIRKNWFNKKKFLKDCDMK